MPDVYALCNLVLTRPICAEPDWPPLIDATDVSPQIGIDHNKEQFSFMASIADLYCHRAAYSCGGPGPGLAIGMLATQPSEAGPWM